ncbi:class I SAM-dependent DNA methyltransferase [Pseudahrensia aquimaris]|uniref:Class I SAM-dependent DNA methyltransferase n=1 Tax=Pseudahrensia aquimaris TaxID=744461 RepID=A0ABW3FJN4_9HYPH
MADDSQKDPANGHFSRAYSLDSKDATLDHYKKWAADYDREIGEENGYAQPSRVAQALVDQNFDVHSKVFDAGCGSGLSGVALRSIGCDDITGCDFSPEMLNQAEAKSVYTALFEADLNQPLAQIPPNHFAAVVAVGVFSFGHVDPDACDELLRILQPNGLFIIALNEPFWEQGHLRKKLDAMEASGRLTTLSREHGDHLPGHDVMGWVLTMRKSIEFSGV